MKDFIVFFHIEKASGSTLHNLLKYNLPTYVSLRSWHPWTNEKIADFNVKDLKRLRKLYPFLRGIGGHTTRPYLDYNKAFSNSEDKVKTFMFVREPVSRYLSHLQYQIHKKKINWDIESYCTETRFSNLMVKRIAGCENLELAKEIVSTKIHFIGIQEEFNKSLILMNKILFDNKIDIRYESLNVGRVNNKIEFKSFDKEIQGRILENNKLDIELYNYIMKNVYNRYLKVYENLDQELLIFEKELTTFKYNLFRKKLLKVSKAYNHFVSEPLVRLFH